jgi:ribosome-binding ATPase
LNQLSAEEQRSFLEDLGLQDSLRGRFIRRVYETIDYISFFTVGPDEVRAWNIFKNSPALKAAGRIHSDIERGFIKAEVIGYEEFMEFKDEVKARSAGKIRSEGKEYIVKDGDIVHFRFNV